MSRVVEHALSVDAKITQLNRAWPHIVETYTQRVRDEVADRALFLRRYEAATQGRDEETTLAMVEPRFV